MAVNYYPNRSYDPTSQSFYVNPVGVGQDNFLYNNGIVIFGAKESTSEEYYGRDLRIQPATAGEVKMGPGTAVLFGTLTTFAYEEFTFDSTVASPRYDAVVLKYDIAAKTVTRAIIKGIEAGVPSYPAVTDTANEKYLLIAYVRLNHPFVTATTAIPADRIIDARTFIETNESIYITGTTKHNLVTNPEFAVYSAASGTATTGLPEGFYLDAGACVVSRELNSTGDSPRGYVCKFRGNTGGLIKTQVNIPQRNPFVYGTTSSSSAADRFYGVYTASVRLKLEAGKAVAVRIRDGSGIIGQTTYYYNANTSVWFNAVVRGYSINTSYNSLILEIEDLALATASYIYISFVSLTLGNIPILYDRKSELILFKNAVAVTGYTSASSHSTGTDTLDIAEIGNCVASDVRALIVRVTIWDSGSAAGTAYVILSGTERVECSGITNGHYEEDVVWAWGLSPFSATVITVDKVATGVNTLKIVLYIIGAVT